MSNEWKLYLEAVESWLIMQNNRVGYFAETINEIYYLLSCEIPLPHLDDIPMILLPLRFHLAMGDEFGCGLKENDILTMIGIINEYWKQAKIEWYLEEILYMNIKSHTEMDENSLFEIRNQIWSLHRDPNTGKMKNKDIRRQLFLDKLIKGYQSDLNTFDIYLFEFIGQESQGCCISRETHTIIIGSKSTKGYIEPTIRPLPCLAKTIAHELGHALQLDHPKGMNFSYGVSCTLKYNHDNLMIGGADIKGGGGTKLEDWQILVTRKSAEEFWKCQN